MRKLIVLLMFIPSLVHAACRTITFNSTTNNPYEVGSAIPGLGSQYHGSVTNPTFDPLWMRAIDCDECTLIGVEANGSYKTLETNFCGPSTAAWDSCIAINFRGGHCRCAEGPTEYYIPWVIDCPYWPGPVDDRAHRASRKYHNIANEPSSPSVAFIDYSRVEPFGGNGSITFSSPYPKYISFYYSGGDTSEYFNCNSSNFQPSSGSLPGTIKFYDSSNNQLGSISLNQSGHTWNTQCSGDPHGQYCEWTKIEYWNNTGIAKMTFTVGYISSSFSEPHLGFYIDDLQVCNTLCPDPPCEFE